MKIAFLTPEYPHPKTGNSGGIGTSILALSQGLTSLGCEISILVYGQNEDDYFVDKNIHFYKIKNIKVKGLSLFLTQKKVERLINSLYDSGKIKFFVVSGDNGSKEYDEPRLMKNELIKAGIPATRIFCDYAGFSTIDSVLRMKLIFQQTTFYIISQKFHVDRALYIAQRNGLKAKGIFANDVPDCYSPYLKYREQLARVKAVFEVLTSKSPYYAGKPIKIN